MSEESVAASPSSGALAERIAQELSRDLLSEAHEVADHALQRHGADAIGPILFYGSCQRAESAEGILDVYLLSKSNRAFHDAAVAAGLNWLVPPTIYYYELHDGERVVRAKSAVISEDQFASSCRDETTSPSIWARFCQPAVLLRAPDEATRQRVIDMLVDAVKTAAWWAAHLGPESGTAEDFWVALFMGTYASELRPERIDRARLIYETYPERYDAMLPEAWAALGIPFRREGDRYVPEVSAEARAEAKAKWARRVKAGKVLSVVRVLKGTLTFDGGVDYLLWKIERHSGKKIETTPWQRKHPFLAGPVVLAKMVRAGMLR
ncbi:MAG: hypothetical protein R3B99_24240 [Polyangiales bacterium]